MSSHEFSWNQNIVTDGFPSSLGTEPKSCFPWELKVYRLRLSLRF